VAATQNYVLEHYYKQDLQLEKGFYNDVRNINLRKIFFNNICLFKVN